MLIAAKPGDFSQTFLTGRPFNSEMKKAATFILKFSNNDIMLKPSQNAERSPV
jgi:hypothetical protein